MGSDSNKLSWSPALGNYAPWLELPDGIPERILERLPLSDYVRFAAVCPKWRSVQREHRLLHAPLTPPMLPVPWLILPILHEDDSIHYYSPLERRSYRLQVPEARDKRIHAFPNGWLLLLSNVESPQRGTTMSILNPITGLQFQLPPLTPPLNLTYGIYAAMSSYSTDRTILVIGCCKMYLFRVGGPAEWIEMPFPAEAAERGGIREVTFCAGEFYCLARGGAFVVIDPLPAPPAIRAFEMDMSQLKPSLWDGMYQMVEFNGEILLVEALFRNKMTGFKLLRADFSRNTWVKMESIGDHMLMFHYGSSVSLLAADVGGKQNCIYAPSIKNIIPKFQKIRTWKMFDLGTETLTIDALPNAEPEYDKLQLQMSSMYWIMPSIC